MRGELALAASTHDAHNILSAWEAACSAQSFKEASSMAIARRLDETDVFGHPLSLGLYHQMS